MSLLSAGRIDHVGVAVHDLDAALEQWTGLLAARRGHREIVEGQAVEVAFLELPGTARIELIAPIDADGPVARFLKRRGPGLHHVCVLVDDIEEALARLAEGGAELIDERPRRGAGGARIAFVHPRSLGGVLLELKELTSCTELPRVGTRT